MSDFLNTPDQSPSKRRDSVHPFQLGNFSSLLAMKESAAQNACKPSLQKKPLIKTKQSSSRNLFAEKPKTEKTLKKADSEEFKELELRVNLVGSGNADSLEELSATSTNDSIESPIHTPVVEVEELPIPTTNIMLVGTQDNNIYGLLDLLFEENLMSTSPSNKAFDLVVKEHEKDGQKAKTKLWIQDPTKMKFLDIMRVYYNKVHTYVFIYKATNRESFDCLANTIESIKSQVKGGKFVGLLVCDNSNTEEETQVSEQEAQELVNKYNLSGLVTKSSQETENVKQEFRKVL